MGQRGGDRRGLAETVGARERGAERDCGGQREWGIERKRDGEERERGVGGGQRQR